MTFVESPINYRTACKVCKNRSSDFCVGNSEMKFFDPKFKMDLFILPHFDIEDYRDLPGKVKGEFLAFYLIKLMEVLDGWE